MEQRVGRGCRFKKVAKDIIPALRRLRQVDNKFNASLSYLGSLRPAWTMERDPISKRFLRGGPIRSGRQSRAS